MGNSQYHRSFIILNAQDSGYSLSDRKEPAGYCKLEIKKNQGKMQLYVQDMKPIDPQQGIYDVVLVSNKEEVPPAKITSIQMPDNGRGEYEITFDPDNVQDTGAPIDQFHGLAVVYRPLKGEGELQYPLIGYSDKRVVLDWPGTVTEKLEKMYRRKSPVGFPKARTHEKKQAGGLMAVSEKTRDKASVLNTEEEGRHVHAEQAEKQNTVEGNDVQILGIKSDDAVDAESEVPAENEIGDADSLLGEEAGEDFSEEETIEPEDDDVFYKKLEGTYNLDEIADPVSAQPFDGDEVNPEVLAFEPPDISYIYESTNAQDTSKANTDKTDSAENPDDEPVKFDAASEGTAPESNLYSLQFGDSTYWDKVKAYFNRLFDNHKKVTPFDDSVGEVDWIRVENRNEPLYPYYRMNEMHHSSGYLDHYLVGLVRNQGKVQYVVYGIPGIYSNVPPMSMHGFSRWLPVKNGYGTGYWLLYIDAISGNIAYPY